MRSYLKSNDEMALGVQNAHDEHKASIDKMIKHASQFADPIREIQGNGVRIMSNERELDEEDASEITDGLEASSDEPESEMPPEKHGDVRNVERMLAEEGSQYEGDEATKEEEVIERCGGPKATLFHLQTRTVHSLSEKMEEPTTEETGEDMEQEKIESGTPAVHTRIPPPLINEQWSVAKRKGPTKTTRKLAREVQGESTLRSGNNGSY